MKAKNREINIFNMSLLDILTGALGAFLFLMLGMMPAYVKAHRAASEPQPAVNAEEAEKRIAELERKNAELNDELKAVGKTSSATGDDAALKSKINTLTTENETLKKKIDDEDVYIWSEGVILVAANKPVGIQLWALDQQGKWDGPRENTPWGEKTDWVFHEVGKWGTPEDMINKQTSQIGFTLKGKGLFPIFAWVPPGTDTSDLILSPYAVNGNIHKSYTVTESPTYRIKESGKMNLLFVVDVQDYDTFYWIKQPYPRTKEIEQYVEDYIKASSRDREKMRDRYTKLWQPIPQENTAK